MSIDDIFFLYSKKLRKKKMKKTTIVTKVGVRNYDPRVRCLADHLWPIEDLIFSKIAVMSRTSLLLPRCLQQVPQNLSIIVLALL